MLIMLFLLLLCFTIRLKFLLRIFKLIVFGLDLLLGTSSSLGCDFDILLSIGYSPNGPDLFGPYANIRFLKFISFFIFNDAVRNSTTAIFRCYGLISLWPPSSISIYFLVHAFSYNFWTWFESTISSFLLPMKNIGILILEI